jgi:hypothetical protein
MAFWCIVSHANYAHQEHTELMQWRSLEELAQLGGLAATLEQMQ